MSNDTSNLIVILIWAFVAGFGGCLGWTFASWSVRQLGRIPRRRKA